MIHLDEGTGHIICPSGDTGQFTVSLLDEQGVALNETLQGVGVFAVCQKAGTGYVNVAQITCPIVNNALTVAITPEFSRSIAPGEYFWDIRVVTDPAYDQDGLPITDDPEDEVHSLYAAREGGMPKYSAPGVAVDIGVPSLGGGEIIV